MLESKTDKTCNVNKTHRQNGLAVFFLVVALVLVSACVPARYIAQKDSFLFVHSGLEDSVTETKSGVSIAVEVVNVPELEAKLPAYCRKIRRPTCVEVDPEHAEARTSVGGIEFAVRMDWVDHTNKESPSVLVCAPFVDLAFVVRISNNTAHSIDLGSAVMQLESSDGRTFEPMSEIGRCGGRATTVEASRQNPNAWPGALRVLPGKHRDTYAAFCFGDQLPRLPLTLLVYDVPVDTDVAGSVTRRENFSYKFAGESGEWYLNRGPNREAVWARTPPTCGVQDLMVAASSSPEAPATEMDANKVCKRFSDDAPWYEQSNRLLRRCLEALSPEHYDQRFAACLSNAGSSLSDCSVLLR